MAHFPPSFLDEVLARTDIVEIIARHVELKKSGANLMGLCPFHHEKSPSFSVSADKQLYYCFGCGQGGGAFQFLIQHDGYAFPEAVEYLATKAGMEVPQDTPQNHDDEVRQKKDHDLLVRASTAMNKALHAESGGKASAYLEMRGLSAEIIRDYALGYTPPGYGFMHRVFGNDKATNARLEAVGLLFKGEHGYGDRFRGRLMFAIRDRRGRVVGFGGRVLGESEPGEPKYLNSPETPYFHKSDLLYGFSEHRDNIRKTKQLVIVEGYMDVLALAAHGLKIGLAPLGTAIGERQIREIFRLCDSPVFCFDGDRAGRQAAWRALERMLPLLKAELMPRFLYLPDGEDPDSLLKQEGGETFAKRLAEDAKPVLDTWVQGLTLLAGQGAEGRARMAKKADSMLAAMTDSYLMQAWRQEAERSSGISMQRQRRAVKTAPAAHQAQADVVLNTVEERFLAGLMQSPTRFLQLPVSAMDFFIDKPTIRALYSRAFSMQADAESETIDIARQLIRELPADQNMISRWINQATVQDIEYRSLLLDMEANDIRSRVRQGLSLGESVQLQKRLRELQTQQQALKEQLSDTGA